jgi:hypothetical protein
VDVLNTAQNILAVSISASVGHEFHEQTKTLRQGRQDIEAEEDGEVKPLPDMGQDIVLS